PSHKERNGDVLCRAQMWVERIGLKHHREIAVARHDCVHRRAVDEHEPESWVSSPAMIRSNVDFPHPDGPTSAKNSRSATVNEMSSRTAVRPKRLEIPLSSTFAIYARALGWTGRRHGRKSGGLHAAPSGRT